MVMTETFSDDEPIDREATDTAAQVAGFSVPSDRHPDRNEDAFFADDDNFAVGVFDGLGGHKGSEEASQIANDVVAERLRSTPLKGNRALGRRAIREALWAAHKAIVASQEITDEDDPGVATTAVVAKYFETDSSDRHIAFGKVGDSRAYLLRDGTLTHLTLDDALLLSAVDASKSTEAQMELQQRFANATYSEHLDDEENDIFKLRHLVTNTLGHADSPPNMADGAINDVKVQKRDVFLLTSDGVHDNLTTDEIEAILLENSDNADSAAKALVHAAQERSRTDHFRAKADDITAVVMIF